MSVIVGYAPIEPIVQRILAPDELVQRQVWEILGGLYPRGKAAERRIDQRFPYPNILYLTPVSSDGISPAGEHVAVVGKHLSEHGVGFYYQQPLPYRKMIASLEMRLAMVRFSNRHYLVPLHAAWVVRQWRTILASRAIADPAQSELKRRDWRANRASHPVILAAATSPR